MIKQARHKPWCALALSISLALVAGCSSSNGADEGADKVILPEGKADNYYSNMAQEYKASAQVVINLTSEEAAGKSTSEKLAAARALLQAKSNQVSWFLHVYLIDKEGFNKAAQYGGLHAMVMYQGEDAENLRAVEGEPNKFVFDFGVQVGGSLRLLEKLVDGNKSTDDGGVTFELHMAKIENKDLANFVQEDYRVGAWSPDSCDCALETVQMKLLPVANSSDAYMDYKGLLADDEMDVAVHFGWDYHARWDIALSREVYDFLIGKLGFKSPVASYEQYNRLSGPLTKITKINGRDITLKVSLFRPDPCESWKEAGKDGDWAKSMERNKEYKTRTCRDWTWETAEANANPTTDVGASNMMQDLKDSLRSRDVIIYKGHSGYASAFAMGSWFNTLKGDLNPPEIKELNHRSRFSIS